MRWQQQKSHPRWQAFGDLVIGEPWICPRLHKMPESERADGWSFTGDVATIDSDGYMQVMDRPKDVIKSGGEWISSIELENLAMAHPEIVEAAVIGVAHPKWDERPSRPCSQTGGIEA